MNKKFDKIIYEEDGVKMIKYKMCDELRKLYYKNEKETVYGREEYIKICIKHLKKILTKPIAEWDSATITEERIKIYQKELEEIIKEKEIKNSAIKLTKHDELQNKKNKNSLLNIFK